MGYSLLDLFIAKHKSASIDPQTCLVCFPDTACQFPLSFQTGIHYDISSPDFMIPSASRGSFLSINLTAFATSLNKMDPIRHVRLTTRASGLIY